jgi:hypothetical protein
MKHHALTQTLCSKICYVRPHYAHFHFCLLYSSVTRWNDTEKCVVDFLLKQDYARVVYQSGKLSSILENTISSAYGIDILL